MLSNVSSNCLVEKMHNDTGCNCLTFLHCVFHQMHPQIAYLREWVVALVALFPQCAKIISSGKNIKTHEKNYDVWGWLLEIFSKNMAFNKLLPVCSISWLFNSAVLITLKPQLIQVGSNLMFFPTLTIYACAGLKLEWKPSHIFHIKNYFVNCLYLSNGESHNVPTYGKTKLGTRAVI